MSATVGFETAYPAHSSDMSRGYRTRLRVAARATSAACVALAALLVAGVAGLTLYASAHGERIYEGVQVAGVRVGGMTHNEARAAVEDRFSAYLTTPLQLRAGDQVFEATPRELGASLDSSGSVDSAFRYGREGSFWERSRAWVSGLMQAEDVAPRIVVDSTTLDRYLRSIAPEIVRAPMDAEISMSAAGEPILVPDVTGISLDLTASRNALIRSLSRLDETPIALTTRAKPAAVKSADLQATLPSARAAVKSSLVLSSTEGSWTVTSDDLKRIISVQPGQSNVRVDQAPLTELVTAIAAEVDRPSTDAGVVVDENGALVVAPGTNAAAVDVAATVKTVVAALEGGHHEVSLTVERPEPAITDRMAAAAAAEAEALIADGMKLTWSGGEARLGRDDLLRALTITASPGKANPFRFGVDQAIVAELLTDVADTKGLDQAAVDARFRLVDGRIRLVSDAKKGRALDIDGGVSAVVAAFGKDKPAATLNVVEVKPDWTATDLGKIHLGDDILGDSSTYYGTSSEPRRQNVERATQLEGGWLVPPGGVFSYVENVGDIDKASGFATGFGIVANESGGVTTAPVIGGGICQVSTTIFQAAYWAGMPILERYQHPYWLTGYGQPPRGMTGLDAMVNIEDDWALDMKFQNATDDWIAVVMTADGVNVSAQIVGTDPGWTVDIEEPKITNVVPKNEKMIYTDSEELPAGQELQVETAQDGFDVSIHRSVKNGDQLLFEDTLSSSFAPARNMTLRGKA